MTGMQAPSFWPAQAIELRLCDDAGMVSEALVEPGSEGTLLDTGLTYLKLLNNLRAHTGLPAFDGVVHCTGSAHLAGETFHCTSPAHRRATQVEPVWYPATLVV